MVCGVWGLVLTGGYGDFYGHRGKGEWEEEEKEREVGYCVYCLM